MFITAEHFNLDSRASAGPDITLAIDEHHDAATTPVTVTVTDRSIDLTVVVLGRTWKLIDGALVEARG